MQNHNNNGQYNDPYKGGGHRSQYNHQGPPPPPPQQQQYQQHQQPQYQQHQQQMQMQHQHPHQQQQHPHQQQQMQQMPMGGGRRGYQGQDMNHAPPHVLLETAEEIVKKQTMHSGLFDPLREQRVTRFGKEELVTGKIIGRGGFCTVHEITSIRLNDARRSSWGFGGNRSNPRRGNGNVSDTNSELDDTHSGSDLSLREYMAANCNKGGTPRYVLKRVAEEHLYNSKVTFLKGTVDLAMEMKFLTALRHPNIMTLRGVAAVTPFQEGYYLIMDKLTETLPKRIKKWSTTDRQTKGITGVFVGGKKKVSSLMIDRLCVAYSIANAVNFLHLRQIIYRDLKPDNIGIDSKGQVRIFDFGLAKQLRRDEMVHPGLYRMTGFTGSIRYMAPEVGLKRPYNLGADMYSYSMLLWFILALEPPYGYYTPEMFMDRVFQEGHRPVVLEEWPKNLCGLMKRAWDVHIPARPSFDEVMHALKQEVAFIDVEISTHMEPYRGRPQNINMGGAPPPMGMGMNGPAPQHMGGGGGAPSPHMNGNNNNGHGMPMNNNGNNRRGGSNMNSNSNNNHNGAPMNGR